LKTQKPPVGKEGDLGGGYAPDFEKEKPNIRTPQLPSKPSLALTPNPSPSPRKARIKQNPGAKERGNCKQEIIRAQPTPRVTPTTKKNRPHTNQAQ
jgi:hypothetical protein